MRISTNTASCMTSKGSTKLLGDIEALKKLREAGFDTVDLSFVFQNNPDFILRAPDWERRIEELGLAAEALGITFNQCHYPFDVMFRPHFTSNGYDELFAEMTRRAISAAGMLKIPHGVMHPQTFPELNHERKACLERNRALLYGYVEQGIRCGVRTAIENMPPVLDRSYPLRYGMHYDDVIELVDSFHEPRWVGICWDTGHANLAKFDQPRALHAVGKRLIALHINDNSCNGFDEHLIPFLGTNDWNGILQALVDIDYQGDLTYETGRFGKLAAAGPTQDALLKATYDSARNLLDMYEKIKAASGKTPG